CGASLRHFGCTAKAPRHFELRNSLAAGSVGHQTCSASGAWCWVLGCLVLVLGAGAWCLVRVLGGGTGTRHQDTQHPAPSTQHAAPSVQHPARAAPSAERILDGFAAEGCRLRASHTAPQ